jgi:hypothetical protein
MSFVIASGTTITLAAGAKSADQITGTYQFLPNDAMVTIAALSSATGLTMTLAINGAVVINDLPISFFGATGGLRLSENTITAQLAEAGSRVELTFRNTSGGPLTFDFLVTGEDNF